MNDPVRYCFTFEQVRRCDRGRGAFGRAGGGLDFSQGLISATENMGKTREVSATSAATRGKMVPGGIPARGLLASLDPREPENWSICQGQGRRLGGVLHRCGLRLW